MKQIKTLLLTGFFAVSAFSLASAQTTIYVTGSTAYRNQTTAAIKNLLNNLIEAYVGTSDTGNAAVFQGNLKSGGAAVVIKTSWSGSGAGVQTVSGQQNVNFLKVTLPLTDTVQNLPDPTALAVGDSSTDSTVPHIAMSDVFQAASGFLGNVVVNSVQKNYPALTEQTVGVVAFQWVVSKDGVGLLNNITPQQIKALYSNGSMPLAIFTGSAGDQDTYVYATGRNPDSGTRLTAFAEAGINLKAPVTQFQPVDGSNALVKAIGAIANLNIWPSDTVNGVAVAEGNSGYTSGGQLAAALASTLDVSYGGFLVSYLSTGDAATAVKGTGTTDEPNGGATLTYNGVAYSDDAIRQGQYSFWSYEHLDYRTNLSGLPKTFGDALVTEIKTNTAALKVSTMSVSRQSDGSLITPTYF